MKRKRPIVRKTKSEPADKRIPEIREQTRSSLARSVNTTQAAANWLIFCEAIRRYMKLDVWNKTNIIGSLASIVALLITVAVLVASYNSGKAPNPREGSNASFRAINSIAVLPFSNSDPNTQYLSDGIADGITYRLSRLAALSVRPHDAIFHFKGTKLVPTEVGKELAVEAVVSGRFSKEGESLSLSIEVVSVTENRVIWGQLYEGRASDALALRAGIARDILKQVRPRLTIEEERLIGKSYTENPTAYDSYLKGRYFWNKRTPEGLNKAIEFFDSAVDSDPEYALAYAGKADCYVVLSDKGNNIHPSTSFSKARIAATRALELDETLAEAHTSLAQVRWIFDWDFVGAEWEFNRALEMNPKYATAHQWFAEYLTAMGRQGEAILESKRAQDLDQFSPTINTEAGLQLYLARNYDRAIEELRKAVEMDASFARAHVRLGVALAQQGMFEKAIEEAQRGVDLSSRENYSVALLGHAYAVSGNKRLAKRIISELKRLNVDHYVSPYGIAVIYAALEENDQSFWWLARAFEERDPNLVDFIKVDPALDGLRADSRFNSLLVAIGF